MADGPQVSMNMDCKATQEKLGALLDGELSAKERSSLERHLQACTSCTAELERLQALVDRLQSFGRALETTSSPPTWSAIERQLPEPTRQTHHQHYILQFFRKPITAAASLVILIGLGLFVSMWLSPATPTASAATIDYSVLLDGVTSDIGASFQRFISYYRGQQIDPKVASGIAPGLSFALPAELPSRHRLGKVYQLQFGASPGVAAWYEGENGPLVVFFHTPVNKENVGVHKEMPCVVGKHYGHRVDIGRWKLLHFTDPTTCHCILSTLDVESELPAVFAAVAPQFTSTQAGHGHHP